MSKLSAYTYYQNTTSATNLLTAATGKTPAAAGVAPAATVEVSDAARQALAQQTQTASLHSTNTIWGSAPRS